MRVVPSSLGVISDSVIDIHRSSPLVYPGWRPMYPELHSARFWESYDLFEAVEFYVHPKLGEITGHKIHNFLKNSKALSLEEGFARLCLTLHDREGIAEKGTPFFYEHFNGKKLYFWGSTGFYDNRVVVPCLCLRGGMLMGVFRPLDEVFDFSDLNLRFKF